MACIKMGSDESHFNVSLIVRDKVTRPCPQTTTFEEKGEPKRYRIEVLPLTSLTARPNRLSINPWTYTYLQVHGSTTTEDTTYRLIVTMFLHNE